MGYSFVVVAVVVVAVLVVFFVVVLFVDFILKLRLRLSFVSNLLLFVPSKSIPLRACFFSYSFTLFVHSFIRTYVVFFLIKC